MRYQPLDSRLFVRNRRKFSERLEEGGLAVFNSNDIYPIGADGTLPFQQDRDLYYLSGIDQEETILLLFPSAMLEEHREILFIKETDPHIAVWEGEKLSKAKARERSGIPTVYWLEKFEDVFFDLVTESKWVYLNTNEHYRQAVETQTREARFVEWFRSAYPAHSIRRSNPILQYIRGIKEPEEIEAIRHACSITEAGFRRVLGFLRPGVWEFEVEAEYLHEFIIRRSEGFAYEPIIASGPNANVLHYTENRMQCQDGQLVLMDVGAAYANYSSDMTRTVPVNGRYTRRQKEIYQSVLRVKNEATAMLRPGVLWAEYHKEVGRLMTGELLGLGLLDKQDVQNEDKDRPAYKKYFMHGTSHHLGLNTHDYGPLKTPMEAGMVFTVEPGIYVPEEGIGIRLEDDVVLRDSEIPLNLMSDIPIEIEEIEEIMNSE